MHRVYNFSAGPAVLPEDVLREAANAVAALSNIDGVIRVRTVQ